ncbi:MAG: ABC transporter substrate-binding protein, partial [Limnohabitans sp.]
MTLVDAFKLCIYHLSIHLIAFCGLGHCRFSDDFHQGLAYCFFVPDTLRILIIQAYFVKELSVPHLFALHCFRLMSAFFLLACGLLHGQFVYAQNKPLRIGVPTSVQLQVGRDTLTAVKMAVDEINKKGGVLGRKFEFVSADETENPETGISAIKKLTADEKVDVLIGGYTSGVTLAQLPHISAAKTIYLGVGAASPSITNKVKQDYDNYKYIFRV